MLSVRTAEIEYLNEIQNYSRHGIDLSLFINKH